MGLDIWDAIRMRLVVELGCDGAHFQLEPYECGGMGAPLRGYVLAGPELGWREFQGWSDLKITRRQFEPRTA